VISFRALRIGSAVFVLTMALWGMSLAAGVASAATSAPGQAQDIGSKSGGAPSKRSEPAKAPPRKLPKTSERVGDFVYGLIDVIRSQSEELCIRYGNPSDCLEEAEVCLTMRDNDDNQVKMCLNTVPEHDGGHDTAQQSRVRQ